MALIRQKPIWKILDITFKNKQVIRKVLKRTRVNEAFRRKCIVWIYKHNTDIEFYYEFGIPALRIHGSLNGKYMEKEISSEDIQKQLEELDKIYLK